MSFNEIISLFGIMVVLAAVPSTSVALVVTRSASLGLVNGLAVSLGIVVGDLFFVCLAFWGLSALAESMAAAFVVVKTLGGFCLIIYGISLFRDRADRTSVADMNKGKKSLFASVSMGFLITVGDIKAIIFYASFLPVFINFETANLSDLFSVVVITLASVGGVKIVYAVIAEKIAIFSQRKIKKVLPKKVAGLFMIGSGTYLVVNH